MHKSIQVTNLHTSSENLNMSLSRTGHSFHLNAAGVISFVRRYPIPVFARSQQGSSVPYFFERCIIL